MEKVMNTQEITKDEQMTKAMSTMEDMLALVRRVIELLEDSLSSLDIEITEHNIAVEDFLEKADDYLKQYLGGDAPDCNVCEHFEDCFADMDFNDEDDEDECSAFPIYTEYDADGGEPMTALMCDPNMGIAEVETQSIPQLLRLYSASPKFDRTSIPGGKLMLVYENRREVGGYWHYTSPVLVVAQNGLDFASLTDEQMEICKRWFQQHKKFAENGRLVFAFPVMSGIERI